MKYDDASFYPTESGWPESARFTHIGMFLAWALLRGLGSDEEDGEGVPEEEVDELRARLVTPGRLTDACDDKFTSSALNEEGNAFAASYYASGRYFEDYSAVLCDGPSLLSVPDAWESFDRIAPVLDARLERWRRGSLWTRFVAWLGEKRSR